MSVSIGVGIGGIRPPWGRPFPDVSTPDWIVAGAALFIIANGISVCIGWWTRTPIMVRLFADDAPTHINTALGFILLGVGDLGLVWRRRWLGAAAAGAVLLLAGTELAEFVFHRNFGIDTLLAVPFIDANSQYPGRMSTNTIACFLLVASGQLLMAEAGKRAGSANTAAVIVKTIAGGIALIALLGYVVDLKRAYGWTESVGMSMRTWAGFLLIVVAQIAALWKRDIADQPRLPEWFLPFLGIAVASISVGLIWIFNSSDARPFSIDPWYANSARRIAIVIELTTGMLILLGTFSMLTARRKAVMAWQQARELGVEVLKRTNAESELISNNQSLIEQTEILDLAQVMVRDTQGRITLWSRGAEKLYGFTRAEAMGSIAHQLLHTRFPEPLEKIEAQLDATGTWEGELSHRNRAGAEIDVASIWALHRDSEGVPTRVLESSSDLTGRNRAERRLSAQLGRLDLLNIITRAVGERQDLPSIFQVVIGTLEEQLPIDFGCVCLYQPPDGLVISGIGVKSYDLAMALGMTDQARIQIDQNGLSRCVRGELVHEPDLEQLPFAFAQRLAAVELRAMVAVPLLLENKVFGILIVARHSAQSFSSGECEFLGQLGQHVALAAHQAQLYGSLEAAYDDLRQTQQAVMRQEKLRVLGQMASGIAHDINNALSPAALYVETLLERESGQSEAKNYLLIIQRAIDGVAQTVARMKEFYSQRDPHLAHTAVSINQAAAQVIDLTRARWNSVPQESGRVIQVATEFAPDLPAIAGNESEIRDALTNLILNAVDAMPEGGKITVCSRAIGTDRVQIDVTDTGVGMDEATRGRCLELFFTTKGARGTGLGLAMVYGTVERHAGELHIDSRLGEGTTVRLIFPAAPMASDPQPTMRPNARPPLPLRILVIDDDPIILKSLRDGLERDGHIVSVADGGQRGIDAFLGARARGQPFSVVITDLGMPHVDGRTVAAAVKSAHPEIKVVLLTGWGHRMVEENDRPANVDRVLGKPPKMTMLRAVLGELTDETST
jgi:PAS domain S-box-containing protein